MTGAGRVPGAALFLGGALLIWGGCRSAPVPALSPPGASEVVIPGVPFLPQEEETCGPSSLAMLLRFLGMEVRTEDLVRETRTEGLRGVLITDLAAASKRRGVAASIESLDLARLRRRIGRGVPVILLVDLGTWVMSRPHYMLAYGYTPAGIVAHSGRTAGKVVPFARLDAQWAKMGRLAVVVPPEDE